MWKGSKQERAVKAFLAKNRCPEPDRDRKRTDMALFREELEHLFIYGEKGFWERLWDVAAFVHPVSWGIQLLLLLWGVCLAKWHGGEAVAVGISATVPLLGVVGGFELSKAVFYHMWELERSCRYDTRKVAAMKMFLFGLCDLAALTVFSFLVYRKSGDFLHVSFLVLVPFHISSGVYLFILERFPMRNGNVLLIGAGCMMSVMQSLLWPYWESKIVEMETVGCVSVLAISVLFLVGMAVRFCQEREQEDKILWNLD